MQRSHEKGFTLLQHIPHPTLLQDPFAVVEMRHVSVDILWVVPTPRCSAFVMMEGPVVVGLYGVVKGH